MIKNGSDVGIYIRGDGPKPVVLIFVNQCWIERECRDAEQAEAYYAEFANAFDLWEEPEPKWIPAKPQSVEIESQGGI